jgi:dipeptidase D
MRVLSELEPKNVFSFFEDICNIPHPSYKEEKISNYLVDFAKERKLEYYQDSLNNVIIIKEASKGYEDAAPIILQGHMDMVCEKTPDCDKNMDEDAWNLDLERLKRCYICEVDSDYGMVPFCAYNLTNSKGIYLYRK